MNFAVWYRRRCRLLKRNSIGRLCYSDNYGVHKAYLGEWEERSLNTMRFFIKNTTSKAQPVDQEVGVFCQNFVKREYRMLEMNYNEAVRNGYNPPQRGLAEMRLWFMNVLNKLYYELKNNRKRLILHSWNNSGLKLPIDGSEDNADEFTHF